MLRLSTLPSLTNMVKGEIKVLTEPYQAYKIVRSRFLFFFWRTHVCSGFVPKDAIVVRSLKNDSYDGHSRRVSKFVPTEIENYSPFKRYYGGVFYGGLKTRYKLNVPVKPYYTLDISFHIY